MTSTAAKLHRTVLNFSPAIQDDLKFLVEDRRAKDGTSCNQTRFMSELIRDMATAARTGNTCFESRYFNNLISHMAAAAAGHTNGHRKKPPPKLRRAG